MRGRGDIISLKEEAPSMPMYLNYSRLIHSINTKTVTTWLISYKGIDKPMKKNKKIDFSSNFVKKYFKVKRNGKELWYSPPYSGVEYFLTNERIDWEKRDKEIREKKLKKQLESQKTLL